MKILPFFLGMQRYTNYCTNYFKGHCWQ